MESSHGQSLVELLLCLCLGALLLAAASSGLEGISQATRKTQWTNQMLGQLHYARSLAVHGKARISLCGGQDNCTSSSTWHDQVLIFIDRNGNGRLDPEDHLQRSLGLPAEARWIWVAPLGRKHLGFQPDGTTPGLNGTLTLCQGPSPLQQIKISLAGRIRSQTPDDQTRCP